MELLEKQIVKIDPKEYGLEETRAQEIESQFRPMLNKMVELEKEFNEVMNLEISKETCERAKELRLKYVKVRTGTDAIHKIQKAFFLAGGRFVDGWKNAQLFASQGREATLENKEKHFQNLELERIKKLQAERVEMLIPYDVDGSIMPLMSMTEDVWNNYLMGVKLSFEHRKEAERKAEEDRIRIEKEEKERIEAQRIENEKLKKEAAEREKILIAERIKAEKEREKQELELKKEREEREKIQAQFNAKRDAEEAAKKQAELKAANELKEKQLADKKAKAAPDKEKLKLLIASYNSIEMPTVASEEAKVIVENIKSLVTKLTNYITEKTNTL